MSRTLIVVRRTQADPKAIWAGGIPQASFAVLSTWMTPSNVERATSRPFFCLGFKNIVVDGGRLCDTGDKAEPDSNSIAMGGNSAPCLGGGNLMRDVVLHTLLSASNTSYPVVASPWSPEDTWLEGRSRDKSTPSYVHPTAGGRAVVY